MITLSAVIAFIFLAFSSFTVLFGDKWERVGKIRDRIPSLFHSVLYTYISFVMMLIYIVIILQLNSEAPITVIITPLILLVFWWIIEKIYTSVFGRKNLGILTLYDKKLVIYFSLIAVCYVGINLWVATKNNYSILIFTSLSLIIGNMFSIDLFLDENKTIREKTRAVFMDFTKAHNITRVSGISALIIFFLIENLISDETRNQIGNGILIGTGVFIGLLILVVIIMQLIRAKKNYNGNKET